MNFCRNFIFTVVRSHWQFISNVIWYDSTYNFHSKQPTCKKHMPNLKDVSKGFRELLSYPNPGRSYKYIICICYYTVYDTRSHYIHPWKWLRSHAKRQCPLCHSLGDPPVCRSEIASNSMEIVSATADEAESWALCWNLSKNLEATRITLWINFSRNPPSATAPITSPLAWSASLVFVWTPSSD